MAYIDIFPTALAQIRRIIVHNTDGHPTERFCVTLDFESQTKAEEVHQKTFFNKEYLGNFDESNGPEYHNDFLHRDMQAAMNVNDFRDTLTNYHQHWVSKDKGELRKLNADGAGNIIAMLFSDNYITRKEWLLLSKFIGGSS